MYFANPFLFPTAGYRLAGMMVENQMRMMFALTDATFRGHNPFLTPSASQLDADDVEPLDPVDATNRASQQIARVAKPRVTPDDLKRKRTRKPSRPPVMPDREVPLHPAE
ncbi:MAG: hypothetical protein AAF382_03220 [Pseudomonadota bacterium]